MSDAMVVDADTNTRSGRGPSLGGVLEWLRLRRPSRQQTMRGGATVSLAALADLLAETSTNRVVQGFLAAASGLPNLTGITARRSGSHMEFRVTVDGPWDEAIDWLEPRLKTLIITSGSQIDYRVVEASWGEDDPPGHVPQEAQEFATARRR